MGSPLAVVTMVYNEPEFLPIWLSYYGRSVGLDHCYVIDHGSTDGSTRGLPGANVVSIPRSPLDEPTRAAFISEFTCSLLHWYDAVAYVDVDEILVADPRHHRSLSSFALSGQVDISTAIGMHLAQVETDAPLNPNLPILAQRRWGLPVGSECKPAVARRRVRWSDGFHHTLGEPTRFDDLFLIHLAYCDCDMMIRRQAKRRSVKWDRGYDGGHHSISDDALLQHVESWRHLPRFGSVDLGRDCPVRHDQITRMLPDGVVHADASISGPGLWEVPERIVRAF